MPQFNSGAAEQIGRFSEGLLLRLLHAIERTHGAVLLWGRPLNNDLEAELEV